MRVLTDTEDEEAIKAGAALPIMERFHSLQGEGAHTGTSAWFIRVAGCDVGCHWCDVKESWKAEGAPVHEVAALGQEAQESKAAIAIVTGGEPTMYQLAPLTKALQQVGIPTHIETAGVYELSGQWDWICFSPKKFKAPVDSIYTTCNELKVVVFNKSDLAWAEEHAARVNASCKLYLQPEWSRVEEMGPIIAEYIKEHPQWRMSLQTHKYLNIP